VVIIIRIILLYLAFYITIRLVRAILQKGRMYYQAWCRVQRKRQENRVNTTRENLNLKAFDVEDARYEEIKPGAGDAKKD
jgi:hypothetical protein